MKYKSYLFFCFCIINPDQIYEYNSTANYKGIMECLLLKSKLQFKYTFKTILNLVEKKKKFKEISGIYRL